MANRSRTFNSDAVSEDQGEDPYLNEILIHTDLGVTPQHITLPVTTRGIGIGLLQYYRTAIINNGVLYRIHVPDIRVLYRVFLALVERKLYQINEIYMMDNNDDTYNFRSLSAFRDFGFFARVPKTIGRIVNAIGEVKKEGKTYVPAMSKDYIVDGNFIPRPENILLSNLRPTVEALANQDTDESYRKSFFEHNSIPGADWDPSSFILLNADEIIAPNDDCLETIRPDIESVENFFWELERLLRRNLYTINEDTLDGNPSLLVSNNQENLSIPNAHGFRTENGTIKDAYYQRQLDGDVQNYTTLAQLSSLEFRKGQVNLLGECPSIDALNYPFYSIRNGGHHSVLSFFCSYKASWSILHFFDQLPCFS